MKFLRPFLIVAATLGLTSCSPPEIKISASREGGRLMVTLTQDWGIIFSRKKAPCVDEVELTSSGQKDSVWGFKADGSRCVELPAFAIGEVPSGFHESIPLRAAPKGWIDVSAIGTGMGEAQINVQ